MAKVHEMKNQNENTSTTHHLGRRLSSRVKDKVDKVWRGSSIYVPNTNNNRQNSLVTSSKRSSFTKNHSTLMTANEQIIKQTGSESGNSSGRSKRSFRGVVIGFQESMSRSLRSSFASVDSTATETSEREKGLKNSTEYVARAGTMQNDAALYIQRAKIAQIKGKPSPFLRKELENYEGNSNDLSRDASNHDGYEGQRPNNILSYNNERSLHDSTGTRRSSIAKHQNYIIRNEDYEQGANRPRRSLIAQIISPRRLNSLCILILLLIIGALAIGAIMGKGELLLNVFGRTSGADRMNNNQQISSNAPSLPPVSLSMFPTRDMQLASTNPSAYSSRSDRPSWPPTELPSRIPSQTPSTAPSWMLSNRPTTKSTTIPSIVPSYIPSKSPSIVPSNIPSKSPSSIPSSIPSKSPSSTPSKSPSIVPSNIPSRIPSSVPSTIPTKIPSSIPSNIPSRTPSSVPSTIPTKIPSSIPSNIPSKRPSIMPSKFPSFSPSRFPSSYPSRVPSQSPTVKPKKTKNRNRRF